MLQHVLQINGKSLSISGIPSDRKEVIFILIAFVSISARHVPFPMAAGLAALPFHLLAHLLELASQVDGKKQRYSMMRGL